MQVHLSRAAAIRVPLLCAKKAKWKSSFRLWTFVRDSASRIGAASSPAIPRLKVWRFSLWMTKLEMFLVSVIDRGLMISPLYKKRDSFWMDDQPPLVAMIAKSLSRSNPPWRWSTIKVSTDVLHFITSDSFTSAISFTFVKILSRVIK